MSLSISNRFLKKQESNTTKLSAHTCMDQVGCNRLNVRHRVKKQFEIYKSAPVSTFLKNRNQSSLRCAEAHQELKQLSKVGKGVSFIFRRRPTGSNTLLVPGFWFVCFLNQA